jgi:uncharacterized protein
MVDEVVQCIDAHRYSTPPKLKTLEAKVLADSDNLDALGATGVARTFSVGGERGSPLADPDMPIDQVETEAGKTSLNHFYKKILTLKGRCIQKQVER